MPDETAEHEVLRLAPNSDEGHVAEGFDFPQAGAEDSFDELGTSEATMLAQLHADVCAQWSWASSAARIPQISRVLIELAEPVAHARVTASVHDGEVVFGTKTVHDGPLPAGPSPIRAIHVPLSASVMSRVDERRGAECMLTVEDVGTGRVLARFDEAIDLQPRDLWLWKGDPSGV